MASPIPSSTTISNQQKELLLVKQKYAKLVAAFEQSRVQWIQSEQNLCRNTLNLISAVQGLNKNLDPHLEQISHLLQQQQQGNEKDEEKLHSLIQQILRLKEKYATAVDSTAIELLFDYLVQTYDHSEQRLSLRALQEDALAGNYSDTKTLYEAIKDLLTESSRQAAKLDAAISAESETETAESIEFIEEGLRRNLLNILEATNFPTVMLSRAEIKIQSLNTTPPPRGQILLKLFEDIALLYIELISFMENEQKALEEFMTQLTDQLATIEKHTQQVLSSQAAHQLECDTYHSEMSSQFQHLDQQTAQANELEQLKKDIANHIAHLNTMLEAQQQAEHAQRDEMKVEILTLTDKVQELEEQTRHLYSQLRVANHMAYHDGLTGIPNRLALNESFPSILKSCVRTESPLVAAIWDVDHFKSVNDRFGHAAGDLVLKVVASKLKTHLRKDDFLCRMGGEEFFTGFPNTDLKTALDITEKTRETIAEAGFNSGGKPLSITISCGLYEMQPADSFETVLQRADRALYSAKHSGRNRCECYINSDMV